MVVVGACRVPERVAGGLDSIFAGIFGVSGCPILARLRPIQVVLAGETDYVELDRDPAMGPFPAFRVRVQGDGHVDWDGEQCVAVVGKRQGRIDPQDAKALIERFQSRGFCRLCRNYLPDATDLGARRFTLSVRGERQDVAECSRRAPQVFDDLDKDVVRRRMWTSGLGMYRSAQRASLMRNGGYGPGLKALNEAREYSEA